MLSILNNKGTYLILLLFAISTFLMVKDPLNLNPLGQIGTTLLPAIYFIPVLLGWLYFFVLPTDYAKKGIQEDLEGWAVKAASLIKVTLSVVSTLILVDANFQVGIPFLDILFDFAGYLSANLDTTVQAIGTIIGVFLGAKAIFIKEDATALYIQKSFTKSKGRKYEEVD